MGLKSAKNELKGKAKEVTGRLTGDQKRRNDGKAQKEQARVQGLAEATDATGQPADVEEPGVAAEPPGQPDDGGRP